MQPTWNRNKPDLKQEREATRENDFASTDDLRRWDRHNQLVSFVGPGWLSPDDDEGPSNRRQTTTRRSLMAQVMTDTKTISQWHGAVRHAGRVISATKKLATGKKKQKKPPSDNEKLNRKSRRPQNGRHNWTNSKWLVLFELLFFFAKRRSRRNSVAFFFCWRTARLFQSALYVPTLKCS